MYKNYYYYFCYSSTNTDIVLILYLILFLGLGVDYTGPASRTFLGGSSKVKKTGYDKNLRMLEERDREIQVI